MSNPDPFTGRAGPWLLAALIVIRIAVSPTIYPWTTGAWNCAALLLLGFACFRPGGIGAATWWPLKAGLALYLLPPMLSLVINDYLRLGLHLFPLPGFESERWALTEIGAVVLFWLTLAFSRDRPRLVTAVVVGVVCLSAVFGLRQRLGGFEATLAVEGISEYARQTLMEARVFGLTFSPDMLAASVAGALPLAATLLWRLRRDGRPAWVLLAVIALGLLITAMALTRSLGGILAAGCGMAVWLLTLPPLKRRARLVILLAGMVALVVAAAAVILSRGGHLFNFSDWNNPLILRLDNWRTALAVWREFPLTGAGPGQYQLAMFAHRSLCGNEARHVHNLLLETLAELGPVGLLGLVAILLAFLRAGVQEFRNADAREPYRLAFFASGCAILAHAMIDFSWQTPEVAAIFWVALGIGAQQPAPPGLKSPWNKLQIVATGVALVLLIFGGLSSSRKAASRDQTLALGRAGNWMEVVGTISSQTWDDELLAQRARALYETGERAKAEETMRTAIALNPRSPFHYRDLASWAKDPAERLSLMRQAVARYPNSAPFNTMLGRVLMDQGRVTEAEKVLSHAVSACRESGDAMTMLGMLNDRQGRSAEAAEWLRRGAEAEPPGVDTRQKIYRNFLERRKAPAPVPAAPPRESSPAPPSVSPGVP